MNCFFYFLITALALQCGATAGAAEADVRDSYDAANGAWETAAYGNANADEVARLFEVLHNAWFKMARTSRHHPHYHGRAAIVTAKKLVEEKRTTEAAQVLKHAAEVIKEFKVDLTSSPTASRLGEVARLHAKVMASTGIDPFVNVNPGYELVRYGGGFLAVREGRATDQSAFLDPGDLFKTGETEGTVVCLDSDGNILKELPVAITAGPGPLESRLSTVFEVQPEGPDGPARYIKHFPEKYLSTLFGIAALNSSLKKP